MATVSTTEIELTFGFSNGNTSKMSVGSYNTSDTSLTNLRTNILNWNSLHCPTSDIVDSDGSSCVGITGATIINTVSEDVPAA